jgi:hypothetical protein
MSNKLQYNYLVSLLFCGFYKSLAVPLTLQTITKDSIRYDDSNIKRRTFSDLKERYATDEFIYERTIENSGWWTRFKFWLNELFKSIFDLKNNGQASAFTEIMLNTCAVIICILVIYFIYKAVLNKEGQWIFGKSSDQNIIPIVSLEQELKFTDFKSLITSAESNNNYRLAIRYYYLWFLKQLNEKGAIVYDVEKTNSDYQNEIKSEVLQKDFAYISYLYDYIWYGEFTITNTQFTQAKTAFIQLLNSNSNG